MSKTTTFAGGSIQLFRLCMSLVLVSTPFSQTHAAAKPEFVVTVKPLELILREVCDNRAQVTTLLKAGSSTHTYDPTPADAKAVQLATAFFWVGEDFDAWAAELNTQVSVEVLPLIPDKLRIEMTNHHHEEDEHGHAHEHHHHDHDHIDDPHFFTDPLVVRGLLPGLVKELTRLDPAGKAEYEANAASFRKKLEALNEELTKQLAPIKGQPVIQFHPSFNYFISRYGLKYAGVIEQFPGKEPSPKYLQNIVKTIQEAGAKAIFSETLLPSAPARVIAEAAHVPVYELDPSCGTSARQYTDYADWLRYNAGIFLNALK